MQAVNPANIATGNGKLEENGLYMLLISRQEEIIGLVKPLLPKPTMKPRVMHFTVISLVSLRITRVCSTNAIIVLFEVSCYWQYQLHILQNVLICQLFYI